MRELFGELGDLLRAHEGIYGTVPGKSYPTKPKSTLDKTSWGVSTESADGEIVYLHVLNLPDDGVLRLSQPADGRRFSKAVYGEKELELTDNGCGYTIIMPDKPDSIDTVILFY